MSLKFDCTGCGSCCRRVGEYLGELQKRGFPYKAKEDGRTCEMLGDDNKCAVYKNRPDVCNIESMFYKVHSRSGKSKKAVFLEEATLCNKFMDEDGVDKSLRVNLKQYE